MPEDIDNLGAQTPQNDQDGVDAVLNEIASLPPPPDLRKMNGADSAYATWVQDKSPANMSSLLSALSPTINSEITRYPGSQALLRSRAKVLAVKAVKTFNPMSGAKLTSWVVTNLQPLSRYGIQQRDVKIPEVAARQAAAVNSATNRLKDELGRDPTDEELADETGMSVKRVKSVRAKAVASVASGSFDDTGSDDFSGTPGVVEPSMVPFAEEAVYRDLSPEDRLIFDAATGMHGSRRIPAVQVARRLGITPAAVSQRAKAIGKQIEYVVNNG